MQSEFTSVAIPATHPCLIFCSALCLSGVLLSGCGTNSAPQTQNNIVQSPPNEGSNVKGDMQSTLSENESPFTCNMSALNSEEKKRVLDLLKELKTKTQEVKELPNGFAFRYATDSEIFRNAAEFITYERLCCPFFDFELEVSREGGPMWLSLKGREGVKDFIRVEFGLQARLDTTASDGK